MSKSKLTQTLIDLLPEDHKVSLNDALIYWYYNIRPNGGYRLTVHGHHTLKILGLESWTVPLSDIKKTIDKTMLLSLDRKIHYPYYISFKEKQIVFYSSKEAMMATMYGSIKNWLDNMPQRSPGP